MNSKFWMASPSTYNVHMVEVRETNRFSGTTCWFIEKEDHQFISSMNNAGKNCYVPDSILNNWEDHGTNYRKVGFKFFGEMFLLFLFGTAVMAWMPVRVIGFNAAGAAAALLCAAVMALFVGFFAIQDIRAAFAPPKSWRVSQDGKSYSAEVKFNLQDKHGQVYYWSAGGTADATRVPNLGDINKNPTK